MPHRLGTKRARLPETLDDSARTLIAAMTTQPSRDRAQLINRTIKSLKSANIWPFIDDIIFLAAATSQAAALNWKTPGTFTAGLVSTPTFTADRGYQGNGSSARVRTNYNPSTQAVNFAQNDASAWVWTLDAADTSALAVLGNTSGAAIRIIPRNGSDLFSVVLNNGTAATTPSTDGSGLFGVSRAVAGTAKAWKNGVQAGADISSATTGLASQEQAVCGASTTGFSTNSVAFAMWANAMTGKEAALFEIVKAYLQGVGTIS